MKIFLLHGDNVTASYERLLQYVQSAKKRGWEIAHISEKNQRLSEVVISSSLFTNEKLVVVDDFDLLAKKDFEWLTQKYKELEGAVVIYHDALLSRIKVKGIPRIDKEEKFELPVLIWKMIDNFYPGNTKQFLILMHAVFETEPSELVFGILAKHVRDLYWVTVDQRSLHYPSWRKSKLQSIAKKFTQNKLESVIEQMAEIDIVSKTSDTDLKDLLDLLVVRELQ